MKIDIIGAGIGGLTTAIALKQKDFSIRIFEQAGKIKPVGAGIILANNAMQVYDKLGLRDLIENSGNHISTMNVTKRGLETISNVEFDSFEKKFGVKNIAIHRGVLQQILLKALNENEIHTSKHLIELKKESSLSLKFSDGTAVSSDVVIGADGINSVVRESLFPNSIIRKARQVCWRGVTDYMLPEKHQNELNEAWGRGDRFGFVQISPGKVYWYALKSYQKRMDEFSNNEIGGYFKSYHSIIREIIESTPPESIYTNEISDLSPISSWVDNKVCLIGDAAHAATPNLGQGACQAIEDAYVLSECLAKFSVENGFKRYEQLRMPKAKLVVNTSWRLGKLAHLENPISISFRNRLMKMVPSNINRKQSDKLFQLVKV